MYFVNTALFSLLLLFSSTFTYRVSQITFLRSLYIKKLQDILQYEMKDLSFFCVRKERLNQQFVLPSHQF